MISWFICNIFDSNIFSIYFTIKEYNLWEFYNNDTQCQVLFCDIKWLLVLSVYIIVEWLYFNFRPGCSFIYVPKIVTINKTHYYEQKSMHLCQFILTEKKSRCAMYIFIYKKCISMRWRRTLCILFIWDCTEQ